MGSCFYLWLRLWFYFSDSAMSAASWVMYIVIIKHKACEQDASEFGRNRFSPWPWRWFSGEHRG